MDLLWRFSSCISGIVMTTATTVDTKSVAGDAVATTAAASPTASTAVLQAGGGGDVEIEEEAVACMSREQRTALLKNCMRYPSPYKSEFLRCLCLISPDVEMVRGLGYGATDLMDLQMGSSELRAIGFSVEDLYEMGLTYEMTQSDSIYAPMFDESWHRRHTNNGDDLAADDSEADEYYL